MARVVWLASYPRSGVTFLRHVIERVTGLLTWSRYPDEARTSGMSGHGRVWPGGATGEEPVCFVKTHSVADAGIETTSAIHLVRDGRDAIVSLAHFMQDALEEKRPLAELMELLISGQQGFDSWAVHTLTWLGRPTVLIDFESLVDEPIQVVADAIETLEIGIDLNRDAEVKSFGELRRLAPMFWRRGKVGSYKDEMPEKLQEAFQCLNGEAVAMVEARREYATC